MKVLFYVSFITSLVLSFATNAGAKPQVDIVQVQAVKDAESFMISKFNFELFISEMPEMFISAKESGTFSVKDDKGKDLLKAGKMVLDEKMESGGFYTSTPIGWEFTDLRFYNKSNAFKASFTTYAPPSQGSQYVDVRGAFKVKLRKPGKTTEIKLKIADISKMDTIRSQGREIFLVDNGSMTMGDETFLIFTFNPELAVEEATVPGFKMPDDVSKNPNEIYVREGTKSLNLVLKLADTQVIEIPIELKVTLGM